MSKTEYSGYYPGVAGKITEVHAVYYHEQWGFDISFETQVGRELSEFLMEFDKSRDGLWVARRNGMFAGAVAIDGRNAQSEGARLRWFIVVPVFQGHGIGRELIYRAVEFCKKKIIPWSICGPSKGWIQRVTSMKNSSSSSVNNTKSANGGNTLTSKNSN